MSRPAPCVLALDHGTSGCKTALVSLEGEVLASEFAPVETRYFPGGGAEQDAEAWWQGFLSTARRLVERGIVPLEDIVAVACSSTFSSTVAVDAAGQPLMNSLTWQDARGERHVRKAMGGRISVKGYSLANLARFVPRTGGGPTLSGKDDIAHVLYTREERPEIYRAARWFLSSKDYFNLRLTGQAAASPDSASLFWVTDNRDIDRVRYDPELIRRLGIDGRKLAPLRRSTDILGPITAEVAAQTGLRPGTPVVVGSADLQSACVGSGAVRDFEAHLYVGTSSWILCHVPFKKTDVLHAIASLPSAIPGRYFCANEQDSAGACVEFFLRNLLFAEDELDARGAPEDLYARLEKLVAGAPAGANGVLFLPWLNGEKTPVEDPALRGGFVGLSLDTSRADMARAVFEGVALNSRWVLHYVERFVGRRLDPIRFIGGGARSDLWCQIFADVLGRRIQQVEGPIHANARGAAFIAGVGLGHLRFEDVPARVPVRAEYRPDAAHGELYAERFRELLAFHKNNKGFFRRRSAR